MLRTFEEREKEMKKYCLSLLLVAALMASVLLPSSMLPIIRGGNEVTDNWKDPTARVYVTDSNGNEANLSSSYNLEDGYIYAQTEFWSCSGKDKTFRDYFEFGEYAGDLSNISHFEYKDPNDNQWKDANSVYQTNQHTFNANKDSFHISLRMKFSSDITFTFKYCLRSTDGTLSIDTKTRYIRISNNTAIFSPKEDNVTTVETSSETTTVVPTTTEEPTVAPSSTQESTVAPSSTQESTVAPSSTQESTVAPSSTQESTSESTAAPTTTTQKITSTVAPTTTTQKTTTTKAPTVKPTTTETTTTTVEPTVETSSEVEPTAETTNIAPETGTSKQTVKAPGKVKIKKIWKKKRSAKKLKVKLKKVKNAKGYQISVYKSKKNAKKHIKAIVTKYAKKVKYTIKSKKLKKKKKLFVGARAYNLASDGTKVFGPWAKIKKVKIK